MSLQIPQAKLPHLPLPAIGNLPHLPHVGCAGADANSYVGKQFGNLPDLHAVLHLKSATKWMTEQIYALIQGELPFATRPPVYAARAAQLVDQLAEMTSTLTDTINNVVDEAAAAINGVNAKLNELNAAKNQVLAIPEAARSAVQRAALDEFNACITELNAQKVRLQTSITCVQQIG